MVDDRQLEDRLDAASAATRPEAGDPVRQAVAMVAVAAVIPATLLGALALFAGVIVAVVVFVVVVVGVGAWLWGTGEARVLAAVGGRPADPEVDARLLNLVDGLCTAAGLRAPAVRVIESPGLNALVVGRRAQQATLAVTTGLVSRLSRVELEGVLADELMAIRQRRMLPGTVAASLPPVLAHVVGRRRPDDAEGDRAAVALTRFPPGLVAAFDKMSAVGTRVDTRPSLVPLWLVDPTGGSDGPAPQTSLPERLEALRAL